MLVSIALIVSKLLQRMYALLEVIVLQVQHNQIKHLVQHVLLVVFV